MSRLLLRRPLDPWGSGSLTARKYSAAYDYREELDQLLLDISINNSQANASLAAVQPTLSFVNSTTSRIQGQTGQTTNNVDMGDFTYDIQNSSALRATCGYWMVSLGRIPAFYRPLTRVV